MTPKFYIAGMAIGCAFVSGMTTEGLRLARRTVNIPADYQQDYTFLVTGVNIGGTKQNNHLFMGHLPRIGEPVEMIYVGDTPDGDMRFQLRVRP